MPEDIRPEVRAAWSDVSTLRRRREKLISTLRDGGDRGRLRELDDRLRDLMIGIQDLVDPCDASAEEPLVLLPVRLETRYADGPQGAVLKVRVYPDEIHVDDLARGLTDEEVRAAQDYWTAAWAEPVPEGTFDALVAAVGARRAGWVAYACTPTNLAARGVAGRDVFPRGLAVDAGSLGEAPLAEIPLFSLLDAFKRVLEKRKLTISHEVTTERVSIAERINEIVERLKAHRTCLFEDLFEGDRTRMDMVVTFLALLEMTRLRMTRLYQTGTLEALHVTLVLVDVDPSEVSARDDYQ
jgi:hypothetical protein